MAAGLSRKKIHVCVLSLMITTFVSLHCHLKTSSMVAFRTQILRLHVIVSFHLIKTIKLINY